LPLTSFLQAPTWPPSPSLSARLIDYQVGKENVAMRLRNESGVTIQASMDGDGDTSRYTIDSRDTEKWMRSFEKVTLTVFSEDGVQIHTDWWHTSDGRDRIWDGHSVHT